MPMAEELLWRMPLTKDTPDSDQSGGKLLGLLSNVNFDTQELCLKNIFYSDKSRIVLAT
jgi:hypothetical protein